MIETFSNYFLHLKDTTGSFELIPTGKSASNYCPIYYDENGTSISWGNNERSLESTIQIHSLYILQRSRDLTYKKEDIIANPSYDPANFYKFIDMYIEDTSKTTSNGDVFTGYIAYQTPICPGSAFYFEKNITLTPSQRLVLSTLDTVNLNVVASVVEFV